MKAAFITTTLIFALSCKAGEASKAPHTLAKNLENGETVWKIETQEGWYGYTSDIWEDGVSDTPDLDYLLYIGNGNSGYLGRFLKAR